MWHSPLTTASDALMRMACSEIKQWLAAATCALPRALLLLFGLLAMAVVIECWRRDADG